ncbi:hypothetical protein SAMN06264348_10817 [Oceanospirillum linum]|nr:hypothetical protein SAMN06264348_10817 [Oceanospirillum linum]
MRLFYKDFLSHKKSTNKISKNYTIKEQTNQVLSEGKNETSLKPSISIGIRLF